MVVTDVATDPVQVGFLGPQAHVASTDSRLHLGQQSAPFNHLAISHFQLAHD